MDELVDCELKETAKKKGEREGRGRDGGGGGQPIKTSIFDETSTL